MDRKVYLYASYIKFKRNKIADSEPAKIRENLEWST